MEDGGLEIGVKVGQWLHYNIINCINSSLEQGVSCVCVGGRVERRVFYKSDVFRG